ncbi:putative small subunit of serine palmitoyltransferase [Dioscorea sansibarensis]
MNPLSKKIYLYNVTMGLYMLDWWERYLFNILILVLLWFICYNGSRFVTQIYNSNFSAEFMVGKKFGNAGVVPT